MEKQTMAQRVRWNPILNAVSAVAYVVAVALLIHAISSVRANTPDTLLDSIAALSLFTFSAAVMGFLFCYQPVALLIENKKKEAVSYFLKTLGAFGGIILLVLVLFGQRGL